MAMFSDIFLFSFCLLDTGALIFILIYFIITLSDLECDYLNASECCGKLNFVSFYEYIVHAFWAIRDLDRRDNPEALFSE